MIGAGKKLVVILMNCHGSEIARYFEASDAARRSHKVVQILSHVAMHDSAIRTYVESCLRAADILITQNVKSIEWLTNANLKIHIRKHCIHISLAFWRFNGLWPVDISRHCEAFWFLPDEFGVCDNYEDYIRKSVPPKVIIDHFDREMEKLYQIDKESEISMFSEVEKRIYKFMMFSDYWHPSSLFFGLLTKKIFDLLDITWDVSLQSNNCVNRDRYRIVLDCVASALGLSFEFDKVNIFDRTISREVFFLFCQEAARSVNTVSTNDTEAVFLQWLGARKGLKKVTRDVAVKATACQSSTSQWSQDAEASRALDGGTSTSFSFHTDLDDEPWWAVRLDGIQEIDRIEVSNRCDGPVALKERAIPLAISASDPLGCKVVAYVDYVFGCATENKQLVILPTAPIIAHKIELRVKKVSWLHLDRVKIQASHIGVA